MEYVTEEQQLEAIKNWFKKYGNQLSWIILILSLAFGAGYYWQHHRKVVETQASEQYLSLLLGVEKKEKETIQSRGEYIKENYPSSVYATLASFVLATAAVEEKAYPVAEENLNWILKNSANPKFKSLARIRMMRLLIAQNKLKEALSYYNEKEADGFLTLMVELKGDILYQQKDLNGAREAYARALKDAPEEGLHGILLKMKLNELGVTNTSEKKEVANNKGNLS